MTNHNMETLHEYKVPNGPKITFDYDGIKYIVRSRWQVFKKTKNKKIAEKTFNDFVHHNAFKFDPIKPRV